MPRKRKASEPLPRPAIADVLQELGADDVPTGFGWVRMVCPFCEDTNGSASVNHEVDGFNCHQCGRQGDALKLLQLELGLTFAEAVDRASVLSGEPRNRHQKPARTRRPSDLLRRQE
jgi:hypothetical protein